MLEMVLVLVSGGVILATEIFVLSPLRMFSRKHSRVGSDLGECQRRLVFVAHRNLISHIS
jgi:hypothetical protein